MEQNVITSDVGVCVYSNYTQTPDIEMLYSALVGDARY